MAFKPNKRLLHERSHLTFEFPQTNNRGSRVYLPLLENCELSESKKATLADYNLLSRSSSIYAYLGAKAKVVNLKFNITFLHLLQTMIEEGLDERFKRHFTLFYESKDAYMKAFFMYQKTGLPVNPDGISKVGEGFQHGKKHREYYQKIAQISVGDPTLFDNLANFVVTDILQEAPIQDEQGRYNELNRVVDLVIFWVNLIRASVLNNSSNSTLGPPIVRLTHGPMFNNVPFVVENYSIRINNEAGYDVQTLLPKQLEINLTMNEVRTGNFGEFKSTKIQDGDNNVGWEAVFSENNMDPYNGMIN